MYKTDIIVNRTYYTKEGIKPIKLNKVYRLPELMLKFKQSYVMSSSDIYQMSSNLIYDINKLIKSNGGSQVKYWYKDFIKEEKDFKLIKEDKCSIIKTIKKKGKTKYLDYSFPNKFFRSDIDKIDTRNDSFQFNNLTYCYCYDLVQFSIIESLFEKENNYNNIIIKFPTITSRIIYDVLLLYSYLYEELYVMKIKEDSPIKDSFIMCGISLDTNKLEEFKNLIEKEIVFKEFSRKKVASLFKTFDSYNNEFHDSFISFKNIVHSTVYISNSLILYLIENEKDNKSIVTEKIKNLIN